MSLVSIVMPAYNCQATIARAINSALSQDHRHIELIVVDDCSSDSTREIVTSAHADDDRVRLIRCEVNGGPAQARNIGFANATGSWIALLDADDAWAPDRLSMLLAASDGQQLVADNLTGFDPASAVITGPYHAEPVSGEIDLLQLLRTYGRFDFGVLKPLFRRDFLLEKGLRYQENLRHGEDFVLYTQCLIQGARFRLLAYSGYIYTLPFNAVDGSASPHSRTRYDYAALGRALLDLCRAPVGRQLERAARRALSARARIYLDAAAVSRLRVALGARRPLRVLQEIGGYPRLLGMLIRRLLRN